MICPKCQGRMVTFNRRGVHIEQCDSCRGIFLDRGELEQIVNAEQSHYGPPAMHGGGHHYSDSPPPYHGGGHYSDSPHYGHGRKRRKSFLEDLFD
jgi:uncharacterized protein